MSFVNYINKDRIASIMHVCPINKGFVPETLFTQPPSFNTPNFILGSKVAFYPWLRASLKHFFLTYKITSHIFVSYKEHKNMTFEVYMSMQTQLTVFWVVTPRDDVVGYHCFGGPCYLHLQGEDGNVGILPHCYMASQHRRPLCKT
jgi:hypothetical protein